MYTDWLRYHDQGSRFYVFLTDYGFSIDIEKGTLSFSAGRRSASHMGKLPLVAQGSVKEPSRFIHYCRGRSGSADHIPFIGIRHRIFPVKHIVYADV